MWESTSGGPSFFIWWGKIFAKHFVGGEKALPPWISPDCAAHP